MQIEFDPDKNARNIRERGLDFTLVATFDFDNAVYKVDDRREYGEIRYIAIGYLNGRLHFLCFVATHNGLRIISFRKANDREAKKYGKTLTID